MKLFQLAREYLNEKVDGTPEVIESVGVQILYEPEVKYKVRGTFPDLEDNSYIVTPPRTFEIDEDSELFSEVTDICNEIDSKVSVGEAQITDISIQETIPLDRYPKDWPYYTTEKADGKVFLTVQDEVPERVKERIYAELIPLLQKPDRSISEENINTIECFFADLKPGELESIKGKLHTKYPHRYYPAVDSFKEYLTRRASDKEERVELAQNNNYEVRYDLDDSVLNSNNSTLETVVKSSMEEFVDETLETNLEYIVEEEGISIGEDDNLFGPYMKYFVHLPITDGNIGVSKINME